MFHYLKLCPIAAGILLSCLTANTVSAEDWFNPALLQQPDNAPTIQIDDKTLQRVASGLQPPGQYIVDVFVNKNSVGMRKVNLTDDGPDKNLTPEWSVNETLALGVKQSILADSGLDVSEENGNIPVKGILNNVKGTQVVFDINKQRLTLIIPEIALEQERYGATDPRFWDNGITALVTDYSLNAWRSQDERDHSTSETDNFFLSLNNSFNFGAWRLHNFSTWNRSDDKGDGENDSSVTDVWESVNTWIDRPIPAVKGLLSVGDYYTPSDVFDSVQFRGAQLASDEDMNPSYVNDFAPVIRGTASSNAQVIVRQNGSLIYQTSVPPGPFAIADLPSSSLSGDFYVTVLEADGSEKSFVQGNASVAIMQRSGEFRYAFTGGTLRSSGTNTREPEFAQGTMIYGLPHDLTAFGGILTSQDYQAGNMGVGALLGLMGAMSVDVTHAKTDVWAITGNKDEGTDEGQSWRLRYAKMLATTGSTLGVTVQSNSSGGYWSFNDAYSLESDDEERLIRNDDGMIITHETAGRVKKEVQVTFNQTLGENLGSFSINGIRKNFHDREGEETSASVNWNLNVKGVGLGLGYQLSKWPESDKDDDRLISLMVTLPLQQWLGTKHSLYTSSNFSHSDTGRKTLNTSLGGTLLEERNLSWNVGQNSTRPGNGGGNSDNASMQLIYKGGQGQVSTGYSYSKDNEQYNLGLKGGAIVSKYGFTLSQSPGETIALIRTPGANNIKVKNGSGITTDRFGTTAVQVQPYQPNKLDIDVLSADKNVSLNESSKVVIPTRGAVVVAHYNTSVGYQTMMTLTRQGKPLPFGTMVNLVNKATSSSELAFANTGIVGDAGQVWLSGMPEEGRLKVVWGEGQFGTCEVEFKLSQSAIDAAEESDLPILSKGECS
jgi:outer membrane usher protein